MEMHISPADIATRAEKLEKPAEEVVKVETPVEKPTEEVAKAPADAPVEKAAEKPVDKGLNPVEKLAEKPVEKVAEKPVEKVAEKPADKKQPNDPAELRKWSTKLSQENAALRDEMKSIKAAVEKMSKKPIDYKELAKDPELIKKQIETERQEAVAEMQEKLVATKNRADHNETVVEKLKRETDAENYPEWKRIFPVIQTLAANSDARINFTQAPGDVLDELYKVALELSPAQAAPAPVVADPVAAAPAAPAITQADVDAKIAAAVAEAEKRGYEKAQAGLRLEAAGQGLGSNGKGGRRDSSVSKDALKEMPMADLKKLISQ